MSIVIAFILGACLTLLLVRARLGTFRHHALIMLKTAEQEIEKKQAAFQVEQQIQQSNFDRNIQEKTLCLETKEQELKNRQKELKNAQEELKRDRLYIERMKKELAERTQLSQTRLEKIGSFSQDQARTQLLEQVEKECAEDLKNHKNIIAKKILFSAVERSGKEMTKDLFLTEIPIPNPSLIPKLIGKEGRNIQTLERELHITCTIENNIICISSHDPASRYKAKQTIEKLLEGGKITPVTIRELSLKVENEFIYHCTEEGRALSEIPFPEELNQVIGLLRFRTSAGQNVLEHSIETAEMMGIMATALNLNVRQAKTMGLLHDIGKALSTEWGSGHALAGKKFLKSLNVDDTIINGVASHHGEEEPLSQEARLLPICDRLSAELPGVRQAKEPTFLALAQECEQVAVNLQDVNKAWAHYASNHIELVITPDHNNTDKIQEKLQTGLAHIHKKLPISYTFLQPVDTA